MTSAFERQRAAVEERLNLIVGGGDDVATVAASVLNGAIPELALNLDGTPVTTLSTDDKTLVEHALCRVLYHLIDAAGAARVPFMAFSGGGGDGGGGKKAAAGGGGTPALPRLLDLSLFISEQGICDGGVIFTILEQLVEASTIGDCEQVFTWVEGKRARLSADALWRRGRLIMLRTCNELLRRLSKTHDTVLRGRVLLLLSSLYALSERSALNLAGNYNRANTTELDRLGTGKGDGGGGSTGAGTAGAGAGTGTGTGGGGGGSAAAAAAVMDTGGEDGEAAVVDTAFYKTFWSLQLFFQQPPVALGTPGGWDTFYTALQAVLDNFETHQLDPQSAAGGKVVHVSLVYCLFVTVRS